MAKKVNMNEKVAVVLNQQKAAQTAKMLYRTAAKSKVEDMITILNAYMLAMLTHAKNVKVRLSKPDDVEKMLLGWLINADRIVGTNFSDYLDKEKLKGFYDEPENQ